MLLLSRLLFESSLLSACYLILYCNLIAIKQHSAIKHTNIKVNAMPVIDFASSKGGAGKTTSALLVAVDLAQSGATVAYIDADKNQPVVAWAKKPGKPDKLIIISDVSEETIIDTIEAAAQDYDFVIVDHEGSASMMVAYAMSRADLVIVVTQGSPLDAREAVKTIRLLKGQEKAFNRAIPFAVLITRTSATIRPHTLRNIENQLKESGCNVFATQLIERDAFKAVFDFGGSLRDLTSKQARNPEAAVANVRALSKNIIAALKSGSKAEVA